MKLRQKPSRAEIAAALRMWGSPDGELPESNTGKEKARVEGGREKCVLEDDVIAADRPQGGRQ